MSLAAHTAQEISRRRHDDAEQELLTLVEGGVDMADRKQLSEAINAWISTALFSAPAGDLFRTMAQHPKAMPDLYTRAAVELFYQCEMGASPEDALDDVRKIAKEEFKIEL